MKLREAEILVILAVIIIFFVTVAIRYFFRKYFTVKFKEVFSCIMVFLVMVGIYIAIHFLFCYQIGFPASVTQNDVIDLNLTSSDWLSFLSGYLGFSGSLIMAILVFKQSEKINELTISEYTPSASLLVQACVKSDAYPNFEGDLLCYSMPETSRGYYTFQCRRNKDDEAISECDSFDLLLFAEIVNNSKSAITGLSFANISIDEINQDGQGGHNYTFFNCGKKCDPADKKTIIYPWQALKRCFLIQNPPKVIDMSWMTINFTFGNKVPLSLEVLIQKHENGIITFHNIS